MTEIDSDTRGKPSKSLLRPTTRTYALMVLAILCVLLGGVLENAAFIQTALFITVVLIISLVLSRRNLKPMIASRNTPDAIFAGESFSVEVTLKPVVPGPPLFDLEFSDQLLGNGSFRYAPDADSRVRPWDRPSIGIPELDTLQPFSCDVRTALLHRGAYRSFDYRTSSNYPFGLWSMTLTRAAEMDLTVFPKPVTPPVLEQLLAIGQGTKSDTLHHRRDVSGEFKGLREFANGDPVKLIHWPLSSRYQKLVVREFDPPSPEEVVVAFHSYTPSDAPRMRSPEYALQLLCGSFLSLHHDGTEFTFISSFNDWEPIRVGDSPDELDEALENLALADVQPLSDLRGLTDVLDDMAEDDRRVIVLSNTPRRHWQGLLGDHHSLICLDCTLTIDAQAISNVHLRRRFEAESILQSAGNV